MGSWSSGDGSDGTNSPGKMNLFIEKGVKNHGEDSMIKVTRPMGKKGPCLPVSIHPRPITPGTDSSKIGAAGG